MNEDHKKLFLLDAMALVFRAYFAFSNNHRVNSKGLNTSAMFGFTNTLNEILKKEKPTHIAVVFDTAAPTFRHDSFETYKAHREEMPEDLAIAIPYIKKIVECFNIPVYELDGFEADDIIGTFSVLAEKAGFQTFMMTPDKDYAQLVTEHIHIYKPARLGNGAEIMGVKEVCEKFGIERPSQVIDILGLMGDKVDNIPGVPGVGEKTATALIQEFGSIENILANTDKLKGKLKEKIEMNKEMAIKSKELATIHCEVPIAFVETDLLRREPNKDALMELFTELEFRRLAQQILGEEIQAAPTPAPSKGNPAQIDMFSQPAPFGKLREHPGNTLGVHPLDKLGVQVLEGVEIEENKNYQTIHTVKHNYQAVTDADGRKKLIAYLLQQKEISFDTETTGIDTMQAELVGLSFSVKVHEGWYVPIPADQKEAQLIVDEFKIVYENENIVKIGQNIKYDMNILSRYGIQVKGNLFDTMVAHYLIQPEMRHNMNILAETYLGYSPVSIETLIGKKGKDQGSMRDVAIEQIAEYASEDADVTLQLKEKFIPMLEQTQTLSLLTNVEIPLIPVLSAMEQEGIRLDIGALKELSKELEGDIAKLDGEIQSMAGTPFNISSPKQVGDILFEILKIDEKPKKTKTGQYATSEDILSKLSGKHPIVNLILDYREIVKLKSTYVDALPLMVNPNTGRIHSSFNQVVAVTGRLSSDNPNLQNIPIRTTRGKEVRKAFVPRDKNHLLLSADYSQIELRIMAHLCQDPSLLEAFHQNLDIHTATASKVFGVELADVDSDMRRKAKMVNFGIIYGISAFGLSERLNIPRKEAASIIENYFIQYPLIKDYMDGAIESARKLGYVETILGRKRYLRDINSQNQTVRGFAERNAINAPIQGSAADMIKVAMIHLHKAISDKKLKSKMVLQVHDELVFDVPLEEKEEVRALVIKHMQEAMPLSVPVLVEAGTGDNWLEAH
ncbi:MAG: DNA polymerase I [Bacteroidetes bacterium]|nr:DNA polymerase I [Bacteroidota bacterium]